MKASEVGKTAHSVPLTSPAYPKGPYRFVNREFLVITYRTDPEKLRAVVRRRSAIDIAPNRGGTLCRPRRSGVELREPFGIVGTRACVAPKLLRGESVESDQRALLQLPLAVALREQRPDIPSLS